MMIHLLDATTTLPTADLFTTGGSLASKFVKFALGVGAAVIAWFLVKQLAKAGTFLAAAIAIVAAIVLFWGLANVNNAKIRQPFNDTVNDLGMSQQYDVVPSTVIASRIEERT